MSRSMIVAASAIAAISIVAGCRKESEGRAPAAETARAVTPPTESPGALATRREAQASFDEARAAFTRGELARSSEALQAAASFMREQGQNALPDTKAALEGAARQLDDLAGDVATGSVKSAARLNATFAAANRAEAAHHLAFVKDALAKGDRARAGEELTMVIDHIERATKDAGRSVAPSAKTVLDDARTAASELMKAAGTVPDRLPAVTDRLAQEIRRLGGGGTPVRK
jgi:hypothetical protein